MHIFIFTFMKKEREIFFTYDGGNLGGSAEVGGRKGSQGKNIQVGRIASADD